MNTPTNSKHVIMIRMPPNILGAFGCLSISSSRGFSASCTSFGKFFANPRYGIKTVAVSIIRHSRIDSSTNPKKRFRSYLEKDLTEELLIEKVDGLLQNKEKLAEYSQNSKKMAIIDANERIYSVIRQVLGAI